MVSDFHGKNPEEEVERFDKKKKKKSKTNWNIAKQVVTPSRQVQISTNNFWKVWSFKAKFVSV